MTFTELTLQDQSESLAVPAPGPPSWLPGAGWTVSRYSQARAVLADPAFEVPEVRAGGPAGSIAWLRSSVSRFTNGPGHTRRRARAVAELDRLDPGELRSDAQVRAEAVIEAAHDRLEVMESLARSVPVAVLAAGLGIADASRAAELVRVAAAAYFPGADAERERAADAATAELVRILSPADGESIVARIAVLIQACDATAALIGTVICHALPPAGLRYLDRTTDAIMAEVVRHDPPLCVTRRVSGANAALTGMTLPAGQAVLLRVDAVNRDPEIHEDPARFDPGRSQGPTLTFGYGLRPCPGKDHALMLAAGVVQAVRDRCAAVIAPVEYEPSLDIRIPARVEVSLR
jgi:cytochrome P450